MIWETQIRPRLVDVVPPNVLSICNYGVSEMLNNANDHSGAQTVMTILKVTASKVRISVSDRGVGIFRKLKETLGLESERDALFELTKGKVTTDPSRHSGEGIFFTSRMFDSFYIFSATLCLNHEHGTMEPAATGSPRTRSRPIQARTS